MGWVQPSRMIILILRGRVRLGAEGGVKKVSLFFFSFQGPFRREGKRIIERWLPSYSYSKGWPIPQLLKGSSIYLQVLGMKNQNTGVNILYGELSVRICDPIQNSAPRIPLVFDFYLPDTCKPGGGDRSMGGNSVRFWIAVASLHGGTVATRNITVLCSVVPCKVCSITVLAFSSFLVLRSYYYPLVFLASLFGYVSGGADALADLISEFPGMVDQYCSLPEDGVETFLSPNHATGNVHAAGCPPWRIVNINRYRHVPPLAPPPT